jgi:hypothetical protein
LGAPVTATIALGLPHTPWIPERVKSLAEMRATLDRSGAAEHVQLFHDKESNRVWPLKLWRWGVQTEATHLLQLQDDVIPYEHFWPCLRAMLDAVPDKIIGLESNHPLGPEMYRTGRRWYRTRAWLVGVGYCWPTDPVLQHGLPNFIRWCDANPELVQANNEDSLVNLWAEKHGFDIWHPVPTIIDHNLTLPSTYANDAHPEWSMYRRPTVSYLHQVPSQLAQDWRTSLPPLLPGAGTQRCWSCLVAQAPASSQESGCRICPQCAYRYLGAYLMPRQAAQ